MVDEKVKILGDSLKVIVKDLHDRIFKLEQDNRSLKRVIVNLEGRIINLEG